MEGMAVEDPEGVAGQRVKLWGWGMAMGLGALQQDKGKAVGLSQSHRTRAGQQDRGKGNGTGMKGSGIRASQLDQGHNKETRALLCQLGTKGLRLWLQV